MARVEDAAGDGVGTGFAIPDSSLKPAWADELVFVTNEHVVSPNNGTTTSAAGQPRPEEATRARGRV